ncbi:MAG TPA: AsmA family protein [Gallionella sp.]|nr:AsmA family protein [Gallionella sp.]
MKWLKRILIAVAVLLVVAAALPFLIPLNSYIPPLEKFLSSRINEPVRITSIRLSVMPLPQVTIDGITVGKTDDIKLGKIQVTPDLWSLLGTDKVIRNIEIDSLNLTRKGLDKIQAWAKSSSAEPAQPAMQVRVVSVQLNNSLLNFDGTPFGPFDARASMNHEGGLEHVSLATRDQKLTASIRPEQANYHIDASAKAWTLPLGPALMFDELSIKGIATLTDVNLTQISARLYGGTAHGKATIGWKKGLQVRGNLDINQVEVRKIASLLLPKLRVSGRLTAKPVFSAAAASADQLMNALRLETPFNVQNGVLYGVDIQKAATSMIKQGPTGGETRFDELSGYLEMAHGNFRFTQLKIASGALAADGDVNISPQNRLSGRLNTQIRALGSTTKVPLNVSGTLDAPLLFPTGGTIAGAAVGTTLMGPGVGTSVGAKVGGWFENLFGKKEAKKTGK